MTESKVHNPHDAGSPGSLRATTAIHSHTYVLRKSPLGDQVFVQAGDRVVLGSHPTARLQGQSWAKPDLTVPLCLLHHLPMPMEPLTGFQTWGLTTS